MNMTHGWQPNLDKAVGGVFGATCSTHITPTHTTINTLTHMFAVF